MYIYYEIITGEKTKVLNGDPQTAEQNKMQDEDYIKIMNNVSLISSDTHYITNKQLKLKFNTDITLSSNNMPIVDTLTINNCKLGDEIIINDGTTNIVDSLPVYVNFDIPGKYRITVERAQTKKFEGVVYVN